MSHRPIPYKAAFEALRHSLGWVESVPGKGHVTVVAQPQWLGGEHWSVTRRGEHPDEGTVWTGTDWAPSDLPADQIYRWDLVQAVREHARAVASLAVRTEARDWSTTPDGFAAEFLAEFAPAEVA